MAENQNQADNYSASNIQVLEGLEAVRKRPATSVRRVFTILSTRR